MSFDRNDIVTKKRLGDALNKEIVMGFEHNDIVTMDVMNKAIEESGGGGGGEISTATVTFINSEEDTHYKAYPIHLVDGVITQTQVQVETSVDLQIPLGENGTDILMLVGMSAQLFEEMDWNTAPVLTGDIEAILDGEYTVGFKVTGDGTITIVGTGVK